MMKRPSPRQLKWGLGGAGGLLIALLGLSCDRDYERSTRRGRFTLIEQIHANRSPFFYMAESGGEAFLAVPQSNESIRGQKLTYAGKPVWLATGTDRFFIDASPDGEKVLLQSHSYEQPWRILLPTGEEIVVPEPDSLWRNEGHDYPFDFWKWNPDGRSIEAFTHGWREDPLRPRQLTRYRRIWRIDANDGSARVIAACEQPDSRTPDWTGTACAATPAVVHGRREY